MGLIRGIIGLTLAVLFTIFAVANRQEVEIAWSPVHPHANLPLYIIALGLLALGYLLGTLMTWLNTMPMRLEKGRQKRQIKKLEKELESASKNSDAPIAEPVIQNWTALPPAGTE
jgi:uncharacterized integral membrane protein